MKAVGATPEVWKGCCLPQLGEELLPINGVSGTILHGEHQPGHRQPRTGLLVEVLQ